MKSTLFIVCGQGGAGKTTTAKLLSSLTKIPTLTTDEVIPFLFEEPSNSGKDHIFSDVEIKVCYNAFALVTTYILLAKGSIILDAVFLKKKYLDKVISIAEKYSTPYYLLEVICPDKIIKERITERFEKGGGVGWETHKQAKEKYQYHGRESFKIDSTKNIKKQLQIFLAKIKME